MLSVQRHVTLIIKFQRYGGGLLGQVNHVTGQGAFFARMQIHLLSMYGHQVIAQMGRTFPEKGDRFILQLIKGESGEMIKQVDNFM